MKKDIHPNYREVVFHDVGADVKFVTRSTVKTDKTIEYEGKKYPLVTLEISSASHPFYTGQQKFVDSMGRVDRFTKKYGGEYFAKPAADKKKTKFKKRI